MLELPEATVMAAQLRAQLIGKTISQTTVNQSPHKFAFFHGDPLDYPPLLNGKKLEEAFAYGGMVELQLAGHRLVFSDGVNLRFQLDGAKPPAKHQLMLQFRDGASLSASVHMYGMLWLFPEGNFENAYRQAALKKPSPLTGDFSLDYFRSLTTSPDVQKMSLKAFLATQQRIPGFGNGVLQEILWQARLHPKHKLATLDEADFESLHRVIQEVLQSMVSLGGRDTEKDLFGHTGGYFSPMCSLHYQDGCPECGSPITKEAYLGGSIYYCHNCQKA